MIQSALRLFVAMPGTNMGASAEWKAPDQIKLHFYEPIRKALAERLSREVELVIEKDKVLGGPIHASMFRDALKADIYIADLTGNNANVYLELGARWTSRDAVTIVVSQNVSEILFNAAASRAIPYAKDPASLSKAISEVVKAVVEEIADPNHCDSPVRQSSDLVVHTRGYIEELQIENSKLKEQRGQDLFAAAVTTKQPDERLRLLHEVVNINPSRVDALVELGTELRKQTKYDESISILRRAVALDPKSSDAYREMGIAYGKQGDHEKSVHALEEAVRLAPEHAEALRNLGGALRRWGFRDAPSAIDWNAIRLAQERYATAARREPYDTYSLLNVAKLELLLSSTDPSRLPSAMSQFGKVKPLCEFNVSNDPEDPWRRFDLAESCLVSGDTHKGYELYKEAIAVVPLRHRESYLSSVLSPFHELLSLNVVSGELKNAIKKVCTLLEKEIGKAKAGEPIENQ
ncbi:tetratricopeptide repeat protein [Candidatus Accumulibacter vicinus]|uniref:TPR repeat-containing protein YrrB n=1 Tax=Candidatus Accumulibacter vicinus TaxID=2954382 RepID=A0A084Y4C2_9PROT|nr:tetratricopeptide repeat protein [Candidatus Accumulibacter vicinus]KFB69566.1 MAG: TPR repeat-containing protein YrrB [Candidatus Accumulibacter vicinus]